MHWIHFPKCNVFHPSPKDPAFGPQIAEMRVPMFVPGRPLAVQEGPPGRALKHTRAHSQDHIIHPGGSCLNRNCWDGPGFHVSCYDNTLKIMADCVIQHILLDLVKVLDLKIFARKSEIIYEQVIEQKSLLKRMFRYIYIYLILV